MNPSRRLFLQGSASLAASVATDGFAVAETPARKQPNLVFFMGEGQRADAMSIAGHPLLKTPHHDRIGREGMLFRNAFCTNALCAPARTAAMTGMYARSTGMLSNEGLNRPLPSDLPFLTDMLRAAGYKIAIAGKVHAPLGFEDKHWDYYFGHNDPGNSMANPVFREGRNGTVGPDKKYRGIYADDLSTDRAVQWLETLPIDQPFCLLCWFVAPHEPFFRPRRYANLYDGVAIPKPATFDDDLKGWPGKPQCFIDAENKIGTTDSHVACGSLEGFAKNYYAGLVACDDNIGKVLSLLERRNLLNDTAILHTSDHGYFLGEWRQFDKRCMHEPSIRIPMMIRYPSRIPAGTVRDEMVLDIDIAPTILDLVGIAVPAQMQGKSMLPLAKKADAGFRAEWYYEYFEWPNPEKVTPHRGIRTEQYKLIHYASTPPSFEMYDLKADPLETKNLYGLPTHGAIQKHLFERLDALQATLPLHTPQAHS